MKLRTRMIVCVITLIGSVSMAAPAQANSVCRRVGDLEGDAATCYAVTEPVCHLAEKPFGGCLD